jgi:hypothetical protein
MTKGAFITLYLCDGDDPNCIRGGVCSSEGYDMCYHTSNPEATSSELCEEPWKYPERFISMMDAVSGEVFYFERHISDEPFGAYEGGKRV